MIPAYITPEWAASPAIRAFSTTRALGWDFSLNHSEREQSIALLMKETRMPNPPLWLQQEHGRTICEAPLIQIQPVADGWYTRAPGQVLAILTADCLPLLICNQSGTEVAALHGGWRSLAQGIIPHCLQKLQSAPEDLQVWLGPAIGPKAFEVGSDVHEAFCNAPGAPLNISSAFLPHSPGKFLANIFQIARLQLIQAGVPGHAIQGGEHCTVSDPARFYSNRRARETGRMATVIWIQN